MKSILAQKASFYKKIPPICSLTPSQTDLITKTKMVPGSTAEMTGAIRLFESPKVRVFEEEADDLEVKAVAGPVGLKMAQQRMPEERQVAD